MQRGTVAVVAAATLATVAYIAASQEENAPGQVNPVAKPEQELDPYDDEYDGYYDEDDMDDYYGERRRHR